MSDPEINIISKRIDQYWENNQEDGRRDHLGGSLIGRECMRELWYSFRWATDTRHKGRILRLFNRGHHEEPRVIEWLTQIGIEVREFSQRLGWHVETDTYVTIDWEVDLPEYKKGHCVDVTVIPYHVARAKEKGVKLKQWRIKDCEGHFGGSLDGIGYKWPELEIAPGMFICAEDPGLLEFKTHGQKSFDRLLKAGMREAKPEHWAQMQTYMVKRSLKFGLYIAINKNTDELYCLFVVADPVDGAANIGKAGVIISANSHPTRMSNNPSWFKCRFCDHRKTCHLGEPMARNCRTCVMSKPIEDGQWHCAKWQCVIPLEGQKQGCETYHAITD